MHLTAFFGTTPPQKKINQSVSFIITDNNFISLVCQKIKHFYRKLTLSTYHHLKHFHIRVNQ